MPCPPTRFPRHELDAAAFGESVEKARSAKRWTKAALARRVGVTRHTIARLEKGDTTPGVELVRALTQSTVLGRLSGVDWGLPASDSLSVGTLARLARLASGQKLREVAAKVGCSISTLSDFERNLLHASKILGIRINGVGREYAQALGFDDAPDMVAYLNARDASRWLDRIAKKFGRPRLVNALRPAVRPEDPVPEIDLL